MSFNYYYINEQYVKKNILGIRNLGVLKAKAAPLNKSPKHPLTLLGDGYNHDATFFINRNLGIESDLVLIDYHSDYSDFYDGAGCANWTNYYLQELKGKILSLGMPAGESKKTREANYLISSPKELKKDLGLLRDKIYLSIDMDAIMYEKQGRYYCPEIANPQFWLNTSKQGLRFGQIMDSLKAIKENKNVIGMDICGHREQFPGNQYGWEGTLTQMALMINVFTDEADEAKLYESFSKKHETIAGFFELKKICQFNKNLKKLQIL